VDMAESDVIRYARDGATAKVEFIFFFNSFFKHNNFAKKNSTKMLQVRVLEYYVYEVMR